MRKTNKARKSRRSSIEFGRRGGLRTKRLVEYGRRYVEMNQIDINKPLRGVA